MLGTDIDYEIAKLVGCGASIVARRRYKLKIKPFKLMGTTIDWNKHKRLLGTASDRKIAAKIGCSATTVGLQRRRTGIAWYGASDE